MPLSTPSGTRSSRRRHEVRPALSLFESVHRAVAAPYGPIWLDCKRSTADADIKVHAVWRESSGRDGANPSADFDPCHRRGLHRQVHQATWPMGVGRGQVPFRGRRLCSICGIGRLPRYPCHRRRHGCARWGRSTRGSPRTRLTLELSRSRRSRRRGRGVRVPPVLGYAEVRSVRGRRCASLLAALLPDQSAMRLPCSSAIPLRGPSVSVVSCRPAPRNFNLMRWTARRGRLGRWRAADGLPPTWADLRLPRRRAHSGRRLLRTASLPRTWTLRISSTVEPLREPAAVRSPVQSDWKARIRDVIHRLSGEQ